MLKFVFASLLVTASAVTCPAQSKEPDTIQSLLSEVHQLRQDIEAMTVASQRVQIALYAWQMQEAAVGRTTQRLDDARNRCKGEDAARLRLATEVQLLESRSASSNMADPEVKSAQANLPRVKAMLDAQAIAVQTCEATAVDMANQLRNEQAKLAELQDRIDRLDKTLEQLTAAGK
jgi:chromosome segregation ATPase